MCTDLHWHVSMKVHFIFVRAYAYTAYTAYTVYAYIRRWKQLVHADTPQVEVLFMTELPADSRTSERL